MTDKVEDETRDAEVSEEEIELRKSVRGSGRVDRAIDHRVPR
ncbi:MAG TPA: hypothetical protein VN108_01175 [Marmoricola sp.]|nr:hypothetical protein [Marmoricola sp.]